jgi:hypothetical protein
MFRPTLLICAAVLMPTLCLAQDKPVAVLFQPSDVPVLNKAIIAALSSARFQLVAKAAPGTLVVSVPDKVEVTHGQVSGTSWAFNAVFSRDGDSLGLSAESCNEAKLSDCTDQLQLDILSAATMGR